MRKAAVVVLATAGNLLHAISSTPDRVFRPSLRCHCCDQSCVSRRCVKGYQVVTLDRKRPIPVHRLHQ